MQDSSLRPADWRSAALPTELNGKRGRSHCCPLFREYGLSERHNDVTEGKRAADEVEGVRRLVVDPSTTEVPGKSAGLSTRGAIDGRAGQHRTAWDAYSN